MTRQDQDLQTLLEGIAPRPEPPPAVRARVWSAVEGEWHRHKRRRWHVPAALAATLLMAVVAGFLVTSRSGEVRIQVTDTGGLWVDGILHDQAGEALTLGSDTVLETDGSTRLIAAGGVEIRLRGGTRVTWLKPSAVELEQGSIYVDTGGRSHLQVSTPLGVVADVGTTFMVTLDGDAMEVAVRDGTTSIDTDRGTYLAQAHDHEGDVVTVGPSRITASAEPASAGRWQWIHAVNPGYAHREVMPLLQAIADDLGVGLEFASPAVRAAALKGRLEGNLNGLGPEEALNVVLGATGFEGHRAPDGTLVIEFQSAGH